MSIIENTRAAYATRFIAAAICAAMGGGSAGLVYYGMTGRYWWAVLIALGASIAWTPFLMISLWQLSRQEKQTAVLADSATAYGFTQTIPPAAAAHSFAAKPPRRRAKDVN